MGMLTPPPNLTKSRHCDHHGFSQPLILTDTQINIWILYLIKLYEMKTLIYLFIYLKKKHKQYTFIKTKHFKNCFENQKGMLRVFWYLFSKTIFHSPK